VTDRPAHYYVYYRVSPDRAVAARAVVASMFAVVERQFGVLGRLLHRAGEPSLWMEVYDGVRNTGAFESTLNALADEHGFPALLVAGTSRSVECFVAGAL
jgi:uncharacterized protein DUF4936